MIYASMLPALPDEVKATLSPSVQVWTRMQFCIGEQGVSEPLAYFGVMPHNLLATDATLWFYLTVERCSLTQLKQAQPLARTVRQALWYRNLFAEVPKDAPRELRFVRHLGFVPAGSTETVQQFKWEAL